MSSSSAILGVTYQASKLGASPFLIGIMASGSTLLYVLFCPVFGRVSDKISRKLLIQLACISFSIFYLIISFLRNMKLLIISFPINGIIISAFWPPLEAWIGEQDKSRTLLKKVRLFNLAWTVGSAIGYFTSGFISELYISAPLYFASAFGLLSAFIVNFLPDKEIINSNGENPDHSYHEILRYLYLSWIANFTSGLTIGIVRFIFQKLIYQMGMPPRTFGLLTACQVGTQAITFFILGITEKWHYKFNFLLLSQIIAIMGFLLIWRTDLLLLWIFGLIMIGINVAVTYFSSIYYSLFGYKDLGSKTGLHESIASSGSFLGPIIGGAIADYMGLKYPYIFCAIVLAVGMLAQLIFIHRLLVFRRHLKG